MTPRPLMFRNAKKGCYAGDKLKPKICDRCHMGEGFKCGTQGCDQAVQACCPGLRAIKMWHCALDRAMEQERGVKEVAQKDQNRNLFTWIK